MGYDILKCNYKLPVKGANHIEYQFKEFDGQLNYYEITETGRLICTKYYGEIREEYLDETGEIDFIGWSQETDFLKFIATFKNGKITKPIERLET